MPRAAAENTGGNCAKVIPVGLFVLLLLWIGGAILLAASPATTNIPAEAQSPLRQHSPNPKPVVAPPTPATPVAVVARQPQQPVANNLRSPANDGSRVDTVVEALRWWTRAPPQGGSGDWATVFAPTKSGATGEAAKYITFEDDTGGWNNIRMAFEGFVVAALLTGRTLVLPPRCRFYLLDRGTIATYKKRRDTVSWYPDFYNAADLRGALHVITTEQFIAREAARLAIPPKFVNDLNQTLYAEPKRDRRFAGNGKHTDWFLWLRDHTTRWPGYGGGGFTLEELRALSRSGGGGGRGGAGGGNMAPKMVAARVLHFPMHVSKGMRYLGGVPSLLRRAGNPALATAARRFVRDRLHYQPLIIKLAAMVVARMRELAAANGGPGAGYSALHIRRNDFQYKTNFIAAKTSLDNVRSVFRPGETLYLATDEMSDGFFDAFHHAGFTGVYTLNDFKKAGEVLSPERLAALRLAGPLAPPYPDRYSPKFDGMIEQLICAMGRAFVGTASSTFTAYIFRVRGYLGHNAGAEEDKCRFHTRAGGNTCLEDAGPLMWRDV